jgi:hypothetical protein
LGRIALHKFNILPAVSGDALPRLVEHRIGQINADDPALRADGFLQQREIEAGATANVNHEVPAPRVQQLDRLLPPGFQRPDAAGIIAVRPSAIAVDDACLVSGRPLRHAVSPICVATVPAPTAIP